MHEGPAAPPAAPQPLAEARGSAVSRTNGKAIASLVLGIVGVTGIPFVASVVAIILGHMARREIVERGEEGRSLATAGVILGWVGVVLVLAGMLLVAVFLTTTTFGAVVTPARGS